MLQRASAIALIVLLVVSNLGIVVHQHYCCGKLKNQEISVFGGALSCCVASQTMNKDCCDDRVERIAEDHEFSQDAPSHEFNFDILSINPGWELHTDQNASEDEVAVPTYRPPPRPIDAQIDFSVLLI